MSASKIVGVLVSFGPFVSALGAQGSFSGAGPAGAPCRVEYYMWDVEETMDIPFEGQDSDSCLFSGVGRVWLTATGSSVLGNGLAYDTCLGSDIRVQTAGTGSTTVCYEYIGEESGRVLASSCAVIRGLAHLLDDDCASAALGYVQHRTGVFDAPAEAALERSAGETESQSLGTLGLAYAGSSVAITPVVSSGLGTYSDFDVDMRRGTVCGKTTLTSTKRSRGYIEIWANATLFTAEACAQMSGGLQCSLRLTECLHKGED